MSTWLKDTMMSEEVKQKDFSDVLKSQLPIAQNLASAGKLKEALDIMMAVEKQARVANDIATLKETCSSILSLCHEYHDWDALKEHITILAKRRAQKSAAVGVVVQKAMGFLNDVPTEEKKVELIVALRSVSDGKIFVEKERAQLTQQLSQIKEKNGDIVGAADVLQEVHVETYGAMSKLEKCEFILEQVRLTLAKRDFIRAYIVSKKILRRTLDEEGFEQCKLKFYRLMIEYHTHENDTLELCRHWLAILSTKCIQNDENKQREALEHAVLFLVLSPYSNHQCDMLHRLSQEKGLEKTISFKNLLKYFTTKEVISYPLPENDVIKNHPIMKVDDRGIQWLVDLHTRITEHNIRVIAEYYEQIYLKHLATMLGLNVDATEKNISHLVSKGTIYAKIDRPIGIVSFSRRIPCEERLSNWAGDIGELVKLVDTTCHLINKENMTHKI